MIKHNMLAACRDYMYAGKLLYRIGMPDNSDKKGTQLV